MSAMERTADVPPTRTQPTPLARPQKPLPERPEDLALLEAQLDAIVREAEALTAGLTDDQFNWRPTPEAWSIAQCLGHLVVSAQGLVAAQEAAIDRARARGLVSNGPYRHGRIGSMIAMSMEPPAKRRFKSARPLTPTRRYAIDELLPAFREQHERLRSAITRARGVDLGRTRVPLPSLPIVRLSLGQSFAFTLSHERRHLWQARAVRENPSFPQK